MTDLLDRPAEAPDDHEPPAAPGDGGGESRWSRWYRSLRQPESIVTILVVAACTIFVFIELQPSQLFRETTPSGGDMGAHVWLPAYIKRVLLPHFQIFGWTMDWYAGFPALTYYFPLPMVSIAVISYVIPYDVAFKLVTVSGLVALPVVCWAFGRLMKMRFPGPACLAIAAVPFLFGREFTIYGGNIASTMAGEFCFSISLAFGMLFLGSLARTLRTGKGRALSAVLLACCGLSHILPLFFVLVGAVVMLLMGFDRKRLKATVTVVVVGGLLISFWALPYEYRLPYATNMGYQRITTYLDTLFPSGDLWLFLLAGVGGVLALVRRNRPGTFLLIMAGLSAVAFRVSPNARLWNARWLPFWFLCLYLLVGVAFAELGSLLIESMTWQNLLRARSTVTARSLIPVPVVTLLIAAVWTGFPLRMLPLGHTNATTGKYDWLGITSSDDSYVPDWITWDYSGYQAADKSSRTTYFALIKEMEDLGKTDGCGRAMYEYEPAINDMGTPDALMLLPYWTNGCIASMEGLYYESSATTPYHFLNVSECSETPSDPMVGLAYATAPDISECVEHLQMFGVKYFMAVSPEVESQAASDSSLHLLASVGPYPTEVTNSSGTESSVEQTWKIYRVADSPLVEPLANQPVVMKDVSGTKWLGQLTSAGGVPTPQDSPSESWYLNPSRWDVYETASGPSSWARVSALDTDPPVKPEPSDTVTDIHQTEESVSFNVSKVGVPVLVKVSYFPNWQVSGAKSIYRATPNLMVVVPTSTHVELTYGYTPVDWMGMILTVVGLGGLVCLWRRPRLSTFTHRRPLAHAAGPPPVPPLPPADPFWSGPDQGTFGGEPWYGDEQPVSSRDPGPPTGEMPAVTAGDPLGTATADPDLAIPPQSAAPATTDSGPQVDSAPPVDSTPPPVPDGTAEPAEPPVGGPPPYEVPPPPPPEDRSDAPWLDT